MILKKKVSAYMMRNFDIKGYTDLRSFWYHPLVFYDPGKGFIISIPGVPNLSKWDDGITKFIELFADQNI